MANTAMRTRQGGRWPARRLVLLPVIVSLAALGVSLTACTASIGRRFVEGAAEYATRAPFYTLPTPPSRGVPGQIVRTERLLSAPDGAVAWRVLYHSTDSTGADIVVSGVVVAPSSPVPAKGRPVVGWGHPTTGAGRTCAPSSGIDPFILIEGLRSLLRAGYVVAAADYPGMGVAGPNSYLIGRNEGNSVLDAVRAARNLRGTGAGSDVLLWGHSQGGHAVLFAAQDARAYAPELHVHAVAVAAPAADLGTLLDDDVADASGVTISSYAFAAYQSVYKARYPGLALDSILTRAGAAATPGMAQLCLFGQHAKLHAEATALVGHYLRRDPATTAPWATLLAENTPGGSPLGAPLFVAQGESDTLVRPRATAQFVARECTAGARVTFRTYPRTGHGLIALEAVPAVVSFFKAALDGATPASTC